jgi:DNA repair photolyase
LKAEGTQPNIMEPTLSIRRMPQKLPDSDLFNGLREREADQWASYLYSKPRLETRRLNSRSHIIALYDPFAKRKDFPAGRRWCVNVYTGCAFACQYCYTVVFIRNAFHPRTKSDFKRRLENDLEELRGRALHPAPIHISNSTDPLQPLEKSHRHTLFLLRALHDNRECFTTVTLLTKNPEPLCAPGYLEIVQDMTDFQVEVTCPFNRDAIRRFYEPGAPNIQSRLEGIRKLREKGISVSLRIDPIFPRDPLPKEIFKKACLQDYGIPESQTDKDIEQLIAFAAKAGCQKIIVSPLKLVTGRWSRSKLPEIYLRFYRDANKGKLLRKGTSYRLPWKLFHYWIKKPAELANSMGIDLVFCKDNLVSTW